MMDVKGRMKKLKMARKITRVKKKVAGYAELLMMKKLMQPGTGNSDDSDEDQEEISDSGSGGGDENKEYFAQNPQ